jgi:hypothetical protein
VGFGKPKRAELGSQINVGSSVSIENLSINPETGRFSATNASKVIKVAEN